jgi:hypothetical protein
VVVGVDLLGDRLERGELDLEGVIAALRGELRGGAEAALEGVVVELLAELCVGDGRLRGRVGEGDGADDDAEGDAGGAEQPGGAASRGLRERGEQGGHRLGAMGGGLGEAALAEAGEPAGGARAGRGARAALEDLADQALAGGRVEGALAIEGLVEGHAERVDVGADVDAAAGEHLGGDVGEGADHRAGDGDLGGERWGVLEVRELRELFGRWGSLKIRIAVRGGVALADEAEVDEAGAAVVADQDVAGLEVAVDEADGVGGGEALADLAEDADDLAPAPRRGGEPGVEGGAGDVLHHQKELLAVDVDVVDRHDVGVREAGEPLRFAQQAEAAAVAAGRVGLRVEQLEGDRALELGVVGEVDDAHAALSQGALEGVAADPGGGRGAEEAAAEVLSQVAGAGAGAAAGALAGEEGEQRVVVVGGWLGLGAPVVEVAGVGGGRQHGGSSPLGSVASGEMDRAKARRRSQGRQARGPLSSGARRR